jgi:hypothetical protein
LAPLARRPGCATGAAGFCGIVDEATDFHHCGLFLSISIAAVG